MRKNGFPPPFASANTKSVSKASKMLHSLTLEVFDLKRFASHGLPTARQRRAMRRARAHRTNLDFINEGTMLF